MTAAGGPRPATGRSARPAPVRRRRWRRAADTVLVIAVVAATVGILLVALTTGTLLGRMTTEVAVAQQRATTLATSQRTALQLQQQVAAYQTGGNSSALEIQRGLLVRQLEVARVRFDPGSPPERDLAELRTAVAAFPWHRLQPGSGTEDGVLTVSAVALVSYVDLRVRALYGAEESYFYQATVDSLQAKKQSQYALAGLVLLVVLLVCGWVAMFVRRTRARTDARLRHQATHDALTGLPNRTLVTSRLTETVAHARRTGGTATAVLVDLDGFKSVNDSLGHQCGDDVLLRVAERLRGCVRDRDTAARLGGDEFAVVLPGGTAEQGLAVAHRLLDALRGPISVAGQEIRIGASVGVAELSGHTTAEELLADADMAMYASKHSGKGRVLLFEPAMRDRALERGRLSRLLAAAVGRDQIEVHYQPIVRLADRRVTGMEALARWRVSDEEVVGPQVFIPVAEETGLICEIGGSVLRQSCRTLRDWRSRVPGAADLGVTVNVSGWQLTATDYSLLVADVLAETGLPPDALTLEITESMLLEDSDTLTAELARLRALGVRLAMDDFGAGYSSLSSLLRFPIDMLKIDRMFLDVGSSSLVRAVAELGHSLGLTVIAEGVETAEQLALVRSAGCDAVQGYLVSRPLPAADARLFLAWAASGDEIATLMAAV
ncbi:MAG TPA: bifunctional diguanylate cyclase/phosphodiesterase [Mycobacteriales bacterium]|nr:bifunctional diguanylate cyclase/phosphodiesterase [Mycobacteriales bacterium]